jgi:hypothetical protein
MKTTKDNLTNNQIFALRMRADDACKHELVKTIDRYLEYRHEADLQVVLNALHDEDRPSVVMLRGLRGEWKTYELYNPEDVDLLRGWRADVLIYIRGIYKVPDMKHLVEIENRLREVQEPLRAVDGCRVEWYLDGPS